MQGMKVRAITGEFRPDVITKAELQEAEDLQEVVWMWQRRARELVQRLEHRILSGARLEKCDYAFDHEMQRVCRKHDVEARARSQREFRERASTSR